MTVPLLKIRAENESELVSLRAGTREISAKLGLENQDQTRIAPALSEISREAFRQAGRVDIEYSVEDASGRQCLIIRVRSVKEIRFSPGVEVVRRLTDAFEVEANGMGTTATLRKALPKRGARLQASEIQAATQQLGSWRRENLYRELAEQNSELASTLEELRGRQEELQALNRELEDTNRGVVALYRELDERAEQLRRADQLKSTFLFHMSHEFRTPLNSITALSNILLERLDGPLTGEQDRQV
ncbi:MAG TPA: histidine kinase dimerization/phospho-acceptor domain-containing protein, partial [Bryobacteraceae bacterium]|nr:histidine kinase dimerization/phospho-acceptor domain-containing protein [Bryobacteraceae bacterium]